MNNGRTGMNGNNVNKKYIRKDHKKNDRRSSAVRNRSSLAKSLCTVRELVVIREAVPGYYLGENEAAGKDDQVLLPGREVTSALSPGSRVRVFLYLDSEDRLTATEKMPLIMKDRVAALLVRDVGKIGAFLDWGLQKDLMLPFREMTRHPKKGDRILVRLYIDKTGRPAASMRDIHKFLKTDSPYKKGDEVSGRVYEFGHDFGTFVAVDDIFDAMIPRSEDTSDLGIGDEIKLHVSEVKPDGKLSVSRRGKAFEEIESDAGRVMEVIGSYAGALPFTEKADPAVIKRETGLSKAAFKRAVGHLYKKHLITIDDGHIRRI